MPRLWSKAGLPGEMYALPELRLERLFFRMNRMTNELTKSGFAKSFIWATGVLPYAYQVNFMHAVHTNPRVIIVKSRRIGISYTAAVFAFIMATLHGKKVLGVFPSLRQSIKFIEYVQTFWLRVKSTEKINFDGYTLRDTKTEIAFKNGGEIIALPNNPDTVRGYPADYIFIDEAAHFPNITEIWNSILPSITRGGNVALISTPRGAIGLFYDKFENAENYIKLQIPWTECPDFNESTIQEIKDDLTDDIFEQEYNCAFLSDEDSYFPYALTNSCVGETSHLVAHKGDISFGIDIGRKRDLTAIIGIKRLDEKRFAVIHNEILRKTEYEKQLTYILQLIEEKNPCQVFIDQGGIGAMIAEVTRNRFGTGRICPITFNKENKNDMMCWLRKNFEDKALTIPDDDMLINSLRSIKREQTPAGVKYDVDRNDETGHADEAIALALALFAFKKKPEARFIDIDFGAIM